MKPWSHPTSSLVLIFLLMLASTVFANPYLSCLSFYVGSSAEIADSQVLLPPALTRNESIQFWPPPENAVFKNGFGETIATIAPEHANLSREGRATILSPDIVRKFIYTSQSEPDARTMYLAHRLLLGDFLNSDLYAESVAAVLAVNNIKTFDEAKKFINVYSAWAAVNPKAAEAFSHRLASEFSSRLEELVGEQSDFRKMHDIMVKYRLTTDDMIQLKNNLDFLKKNNNDQLKLSVTLPIIVDGELTLKLLGESMPGSGSPVTSMVTATQRKERKWFRSNPYRAIRLPEEVRLQLVRDAELALQVSRNSFPMRADFLSDFLIGTQKRTYSVAAEKFIRYIQHFGFFIVHTDFSIFSRNPKTEEVEARVSGAIGGLEKIILDKQSMNSKERVAISAAFDGLKKLIHLIADTYTAQGIALNYQQFVKIDAQEIKKNNLVWANEFESRITKAQESLFDRHPVYLNF